MFRMVESIPLKYFCLNSEAYFLIKSISKYTNDNKTLLTNKEPS